MGSIGEEPGITAPGKLRPHTLEDFSDGWFYVLCLPLILVRGKHGGLMVSALDSGSSGPGSSPGLGHCVVFLGNTLHSHSASLHPGVEMGTSDKMLGGNLRWTSIPSRRSSNTPSRLHVKETGISSSSVGEFGPSAALHYLIWLQ